MSHELLRFLVSAALSQYYFLHTVHLPSNCCPVYTSQTLDSENIGIDLFVPLVSQLQLQPMRWIRQTDHTMCVKNVSRQVNQCLGKFEQLFSWKKLLLQLCNQLILICELYVKIAYSIPFGQPNFSTFGSMSISMSCVCLMLASLGPLGDGFFVPQRKRLSTIGFL